VARHVVRHRYSRHNWRHHRHHVRQHRVAAH
jgi:hypothetical protein